MSTSPEVLAERKAMMVVIENLNSTIDRLRYALQQIQRELKGPDLVQGVRTADLIARTALNKERRNKR
jgi:hypothetical protein